MLAGCIIQWFWVCLGFILHSTMLCVKFKSKCCKTHKLRVEFTFHKKVATLKQYQWWKCIGILELKAIERCLHISRTTSSRLARCKRFLLQRCYLHLFPLSKLYSSYAFHFSLTPQCSCCMVAPTALHRTVGCGP